MKKQWMALILAMMLLLIAGCGGNDPVSGTVTPNEQETENPNGNSGDVTKTEEENPLSLGRLEGGVYTNTYLGIGCTLDSNWEYYSAEELQELPGEIAGAMEGTELGDALKDYHQIMDMSAENATDLVIMNVVYTKIDLQERLLYATMTEADVVEGILSESEMLIEAYAQSGIVVEEMKAVDVIFLGEEHTALWTSAMIGDIEYYFLQLSFYQLGEYGVTLTVGSYFDDCTDVLLDLFYTLE